MDPVTFQKVSSPATPGVQPAATAGKEGTREDEKLRKACASFESFMLYYMLKTMRQSIPRGGLLGDMPGKDTFNMMLDQKIADKAAQRKGGGLGLQDILYEQLSAGSRRKIEKKAGAAAPAGTPAPVDRKVANVDY